MADCSHTSAPGDEELLRFAVDEDSLPPDKRAHLEQCPVCQQRLAEYTQLEDALVGRFYRRSCPSGIQISLYCEDLLTNDERTSIANHIQDCPLCAAEVADTRRFIQDAPAVVETGFSPRSAIRRVVGVLTRQQAQLVAHLREGDNPPQSAWPRQYHAYGIDLSLHLSRFSSGEQMLLGILTSIDSAESIDVFEGAEAELYTGSYLDNIEQQTLLEPVRQTQMDDLGNLVFKAVPAGAYTMVIHLPGRDFIIEGVVIEQA